MIRIDVKRLLSDLGFQYWEKGKNIMRNFVGLKCFVCETEDPSHHLNIRQDGWFALCFRCGLKIKGTREVLELLYGRRLNSFEFLKIVRKYKLGDVGVDLEEENRKRISEIRRVLRLWESFVGLRDIDLQYLEKRGIDREFAEWWGLRGGFGYYQWYVMVPVRDVGGELVGFVGRLINEEYEGHKYLNSSTNLRKYLFGLYECLRKIIKERYVVLVEGIFDVLKGQKFGLNAVGLMGKNITDDQLEKLVFNIGKDVVIYVCLDSDVMKNEVDEIIKKLEPFFDKVCCMRLKNGRKDLAECSGEEIGRIAGECMFCANSAALHNVKNV